MSPSWKPNRASSSFVSQYPGHNAALTLITYCYNAFTLLSVSYRMVSFLRASTRAHFDSLQVFIGNILCAGHWIRLWEFKSEEDRYISASMELTVYRAQQPLWKSSQQEIAMTNFLEPSEGRIPAP